MRLFDKIKTSRVIRAAAALAMSLCVCTGAAQAQTAHQTLQQYPTGSPTNESHIINGLTPKGTTFDLFDYWIEGQYDEELLSEDAKVVGRYGVPFTDLGINDGHALLFTKGLREAESDDGDLYGDWNLWTGRNEMPWDDIVMDTLGDDGYPVLNPAVVDVAGASTLTGRDGGESRAYLCDPDYYTDRRVNENHFGRQSFTDVGGLLQVDAQGYYFYDSEKHFTTFYRDQNKFVLYDAPRCTATAASAASSRSPSCPRMLRL